MLNQINLEHLRVFHSVAHTLSIQAAAVELGVTPSAISQAISKFESTLGVQLFLRQHKRISLAAFGKVLKQKTEHSLRGLKGAIEEFNIECAANEPTGTIAIGAPAEFGSQFIIKWFAEFQRQYPKTKIKLRLGSPRTLLDLLDQGEVDFLVADDGPYYDEIKSSHLIRPIFKEELVVCYADAILGKPTPVFEEVSRLPHLDYSHDGSAIGIWYQFYFQKKPKKLDIVMVSENVRSLIQGVRVGLGIAMIPKYLITTEIKKGTLRVLSPSPKLFLNNLVLVQHQDKIPSKTERLFLKMLQTKPRNLV